MMPFLSASPQHLRSMTVVETWYQVLASRFVLSTVQIDQKCISWQISHPDVSSINVIIKSHLHRETGNVEILPIHFDITPALWVSTVPAYNQLWPRHVTPNYMMLMGIDNQTFFVLSNNPSTFESQHKQEVLELLQLWEYNSSYKTPEVTYTTSHCVH